MFRKYNNNFSRKDYDLQAVITPHGLMRIKTKDYDDYDFVDEHEVVVSYEPVRSKISGKVTTVLEVHTCNGCGLVIDRDYNAAINLREYGRAIA